MDDETFKEEVLDRLRQIMELLTSILPEACIEELEESAPPESGRSARETSAAYSIGEEIQDNYLFAVEKWKQERGCV